MKVGVIITADNHSLFYVAGNITQSIYQIYVESVNANSLTFFLFKLIQLLLKLNHTFQLILNLVYLFIISILLFPSSFKSIFIVHISSDLI